MQTIANRSSGAIGDIFGRAKVLIGMIHCPPFPGAPHYRGAALDGLYDACLRDAEALVAGGIHGLIVENHGDIPFSRPGEIGPETPAFLSVVTDRPRRATGQRAGHAASPDEIAEIAGATHLPVLVGSGVSEDNILQILSQTQGVIVASSLKVDGVWWNPVDPDCVRRFVARAAEGLA